MSARSLIVPDGLVGERADVALARMLGMSRTAVADLLDQGAVEADGVVIAKSHRLAEGMIEVRLPQQRPRVEPAVAGGIPIMYDDDHVLVIDKPVGVAAHPSPGWDGPTVVGALQAQGVLLPDIGVAERPGIVHRLDVGTSGLMAVALSDVAYRELKDAFKQRRVDKTYHALVQGHPDPTRGTIDAPIGRHPHASHKFAVTAQGRPSVTHYDVIEMFAACSLVEVILETGRTHQIRVHMAAMRHPLVGDLTYGADPTLATAAGLTRQWLHAQRLAFDHPVTGERVDVTSSYPPDLVHAVEVAGQW